MKYEDWNNILFDYWFGEQFGAPVYLRITETELAQQATKHDKWGKTPESLTRDFYRIFERPDHKPDKASFLDSLERAVNSAHKIHEKPSYLPFLALLMLPMCQTIIKGIGEPNEYYKQLNAILRKRFIIGYDPKEDVTSADFAKIRIDRMWAGLERWAQASGYNYRAKTSTAIRYVGPLWEEFFFSREIFSLIGDLIVENGISPERVGQMSDREIARLLCVHAGVLGLHPGVVEYYSTAYGKAVRDVFGVTFHECE